jgi:hypothetical protein
MTFHVGQLVACVDDKWEYSPSKMEKCPNLPVRGMIYTVRALDAEGAIWLEEEGAVWLEEVVNPPAWFWDDTLFCEPSFYAWRFRPVRTTNIDVFREIVEPVLAE